MRTPLHLQPDYTAFQGYYQIKLPLEMETMIPADDPVRLLSAFVEEMDLSELYATYDRVRKNLTRCGLILSDSVISLIKIRKIHFLHKCTYQAYRIIRWNRYFYV